MIYLSFLSIGYYIIRTACTFRACTYRAGTFRAKIKTKSGYLRAALTLILLKAPVAATNEAEHLYVNFCSQAAKVVTIYRYKLELLLVL